MSVYSKTLREKRANLAEQAKALLDQAEKEGRELNAEETVSFDKIHADIEEMRAQVERAERQESLDRELSESRGVRAGRENATGGRETVSADEKEARAKKQNEAFDAYLRRGINDMTPEQRTMLGEFRAQSIGTNSAGGFTVAPEFYNTLTQALKEFGGMRQVSTVISTATGATMPMPTVNETAQTGAILAENTQVSETDATFSVVNIGAYTYSSKSILVSMQLLQDSAFDLNAYLSSALATRIGRIQNSHFTTGTGSSQPNGIVTAATLGKTGTTGQTTSVIYDDLVDMIHAVDPAYRQGSGWMLADSTLKAIRKLKDSQGHPLWQPSLVAGVPDSLLGYRVTVNQDVPVMAANAKSILFGDLSKYFIRDVADISIVRLVERYADYGQVGFLAWARADGNLLDAGTHPVVYYANSAT